MTFNQISVGVAVLLRDENCCAAVLLRAFLMWREALQESAWPTLARRALRHDRVLWRLSVVRRLALTRALRFERARLAAANAQAAYEKS